MWGADNAWTNTENVASKHKSKDYNVVAFKNPAMEEAISYTNDIRALFSAKNKDRRSKNDEE